MEPPKMNTLLIIIINSQVPLTSKDNKTNITTQLLPLNYPTKYYNQIHNLKNPTIYYYYFFFKSQNYFALFGSLELSSREPHMCCKTWNYVTLNHSVHRSHVTTQQVFKKVKTLEIYFQGWGLYHEPKVTIY